MATKSFLKNVNIKGKRQVREFANALEMTEQYHGKENVVNHPAYEVSSDSIHRLLSKYRKA